MLLTISTVHRPATDLGYLLHKNPSRIQTFSLSFGEARVFYTEAEEEKCTAAALLLDSDYKIVTLTDEGSVEDGTNWWLEMTQKGGEGMVVKPLDFIVRGSRGLVQPAIKGRGKEYLRVVYGAEYDSPEHRR